MSSNDSIRPIPRHSYDKKYDLLYVTLRDAPYALSLEYGDVIIDLDPQGNIMGIRLWNPSEYLHLSKDAVDLIQNFECEVSTRNGEIRISLCVVESEIATAVVRDFTFHKQAKLGEIRGGHIHCRTTVWHPKKEAIVLDAVDG